MGEKIPFKSFKDAYEAMRANLIVKGYEIDEPKEISYGVQFQIRKNSIEELIRLYQNKKKGTTVDLSLIKDKTAEFDIKTALNLPTEPGSDSLFDEGTAKLYSLCIGINDFEDGGFSNLDYASDDAKELHELIMNKFGFGDGTHCLINRDASREKIIECVDNIQKLAKKEDTVLVFIASHGEFHYNEDNPDFYIITTDTKSQDVINTAIPMDFLKGELKRIQSDRKVFFLDACYSGGICRDSRSERITEEVKEEVFNNFQSEEYIIITSSQASQTSIESDDLKHGVFSYFLLKGLCGAVEFNQGLIEIMTLYLYLFNSVSKYVDDKHNRKQEPKFFGSFTGRFGLPLLIDVTELKEIKKKESKKRFTFESIKCIGIDESGKGDFFGPLVVASVYVDTEQKISALISLGVKDSKRIPDNRILHMAEKISKICDNEVIHITPIRYNELWKDMLNLNQILAWSHAQSLEVLLKKNPQCNIAISDQFAGKEILLNKLKTLGKRIELIQRPKAEENIAVAAASILARARYLQVLNSLETRYNQRLNKGVSDEVIQQAVEFKLKGGDLKNVAKIHFKTMESVEKTLKELKST